MPATFIATGRRPLEPTVYHVFEGGRPNVDAAYTKALKLGRNSEVLVRAMSLAYGGTLPAPGKEPTKMVVGDQLDKPYYTQSGKRAVKWVPGMKRE